MILIGIDTGTNTGMAIWDTKKRMFTSIETVKLYEALEVVTALAENNPGKIGVRFEDARLRKWIPDSHDYKTEKGRAQGAGYVKAHSQIWEDFLKGKKIPYEAVAPRDNVTKINADFFATLTGWRGRTNEHNRDAAMLVFQKDRLYNQ